MLSKKGFTVMAKEQKQIGQFIYRTNCRFCESKNLVKILDFGNVPLAGGFLKKEDFSNEKFYPLELKFFNPGE
jgi:cytochrome c1